MYMLYSRGQPIANNVNLFKNLLLTIFATKMYSIGSIK